MDLTALQIARVVHESNRALQVEQADPTIPVSPSWDDLDEESQRSIFVGVTAILSDPSTTAEQSHESWCEFKLKAGWTLGPVKDVENKRHPLLAPYGELPPSQRVKDALFGAIVRTLAGAE